MTVDLPGFVAVDATGLDPTDPRDLVAAALARAATVLPEWDPQEHNVETALIEVLAEVVAPIIARLEALDEVLTAKVAARAGLARDAGTPASMQVQLAMGDTLGHVVPSGTVVSVGNLDDDTPFTATLQDDVVIAAGSDTGVGVIVADEVGLRSGLSTSTSVLLVDAIAFVDTITITTIDTPGTAAETDASYLDKASAWLGAMTQAINQPDQLRLRAVLDPRIGRAVAINRWDGDDPSTRGDDDGWITLLVLGVDGQPLDPATTESVRAHLAGLLVYDLQLTVQAPVVHLVDVTATIEPFTGYSTATVTAAVQAAIATHLDVRTRDWGAALRWTRLRQAIETIPGVDAATITEPADDIEIDEYDLIGCGDIQITVP